MKTRVGIVGTGYLGRLHARVLTEIPEIEAVGFVEKDDATAAGVESTLGLRRFPSVEALAREVEACVVATTTTSHADVATTLIESGCDVMIEKPITSTVEDARRLITLAERNGKLIQVGHVERYNPAFAAVVGMIKSPRFIEADRLGVFVGRSLDVDVILDLMIHDINLVLSLTGESVTKVDAVGIPVLTSKVDMANVRLELEGGCVANLTTSRVSMDRVRKVRVFDDNFYVSIDTREQEVKAFTLSGGAERKIEPIDVTFEKKEPLRAELEAFVEVVRSRTRPLVSGEDGLAALEVALQVGAACDASLQRIHQGRG
jgi:predicted dehydrogenase